MYLHSCRFCGKIYGNYQKHSKYCSMDCYDMAVLGEKQTEPHVPSKIESQWWLDDCPFHNGQLKESDMENMPDWYFI